jgi:acyl-CoA synthetase (AMP-forming)/AMP-acid ligase II
LAESAPEKRVYYEVNRDGELTKEIDYRTLYRKSAALGTRLMQEASPGARMLLALPNGIDFVIAFFACLWSGMIAVPLPPLRRRTMTRLEHVAADSGARVILTRDMRPSAAGFLGENRLKLIDPAVAADGDARASAQEPAAEQPAFLQYTSGSTGHPKGVVVTHRNILDNAGNIAAAFAHDSSLKGAIWLPFFHDMGLLGVLQIVFAGGDSAILSPIDVVQRPLLWLSAISRFGIRTSGGPNFIYDLCNKKIDANDRRGLDLSSWKVAFSGAEPVRAQTVVKFIETFADCGFAPSAFLPTYGMAETTLLITSPTAGTSPSFRTLEDKSRGGNSVLHGDRPYACCGRPWGDTRVRIRDAETKEWLGEGRLGEICVAGSSLSAGYWQNPEANAATFFADDEGSRWIATGDLGFFADGELFIAGRLKDLIIVRGRKIAAEDLEARIELRCGEMGVTAAVAFSYDAGDAEHLAVIVEMDGRGAYEMAAKTIRSILSADFEVAARAIRFAKKAALPRTSSGKKRRSSCRELFLEGRFSPETGAVELAS